MEVLYSISQTCVILISHNGGIWAYIDYRKLNKYTQKDYFFLIFISTFLKEVVGYKLYIFMDGHSSYNQISITSRNHYKMAFTTPWSTFIYEIMLFGLCNALVVFQRLMSFAFSNLLHKFMTMFINDFSIQPSKITYHDSVMASLQRCKKI